MAGTNKLIKYAILENDTTGYDTITDNELIGLVGSGDSGIQFGAVARSNILNGLFRQLTKTNKVFGDLVMNNYGSDITIQTSNTDAVYEGYMKKAIENISKGVAVTKAETITFTGTKSGVTVNAQGLVTNVVALAYTDLPSVAQNTFLGRTEASSGAVSAISAETVLTTIGAVPKTRTLAGLDLTENRSRDALLGMSTGTGFVKRTADNAYSVTSLAYADLPSISENTFLGRTASGNGEVSALNRDSLLGVSSSGFVKRTGANTYGIDNNTYAVASTVALKDTTTYLGVSQQSFTPKFWVGVQADYNIIVANNAVSSDVLYIII